MAQRCAEKLASENCRMIASLGAVAEIGQLIIKKVTGSFKPATIRALHKWHRGDNLLSFGIQRHSSQTRTKNSRNRLVERDSARGRLCGRHKVREDVLNQSFRTRMYESYGRLQKVLAPGLRYSQYHYLDVLRREIPPRCKWLDIGCGHNLFGSWMMNEERELTTRAQEFVGIDLDQAGIAKHQTLHFRVIGNLEKLPFPNDRFDVVTANMVIEHIERPDVVFGEIFRVLRNSGTFIFHTPNRDSLQNAVLRKLPQALKNKLALILEGRNEEDVFPAYYRLNTVEEIERLSARHSFAVQAIDLFNSSAQTAALGPLSIPELLFLRMLQRPTMAHRRTNLVAILSKSLNVRKTLANTGV